MSIVLHQMMSRIPVRRINIKRRWRLDDEYVNHKSKKIRRSEENSTAAIIVLRDDRELRQFSDARPLCLCCGDGFYSLHVWDRGCQKACFHFVVCNSLVNSLEVVRHEATSVGSDLGIIIHVFTGLGRGGSQLANSISICDTALHNSGTLQHLWEKEEAVV